MSPTVGVAVKCRWCGQVKSVPVSLSEWSTYEEHPEGYIQDTLPSLSPEDRELFISRTCSKCWDEMFGESDEEGEAS